MRNKILIIYFILGFNTFRCLAQIQKPIIDRVAYNSWAAVGGVQISNDGKFVIFTINNEPLNGKTIVLKSTDGKWERKYLGGSGGSFSPNSQIAVLDKHGGGIVVFLKDKEELEFSNPKYFVENLGLFVYKREGDLIIEDPLTRKRDVIANVKTYKAMDRVEGLLLTLGGHLQNEIMSFAWYDLRTKKITKFWEGDKIDNIISGMDGEHIAFIAEDSRNVGGRKICIYYHSSNTVEVVFEENKLTSQSIANLNRFCADNQNLIVTLREKDDSRSKDSNAVDLNIWSYKDDQLQTKQLMSPYSVQTGLINGKEKRLVLLTKDNEFLKISSQSKSAKWGIIETYSKSKGVSGEVTKDVAAVSLATGKRIKMNRKLVTFSMISPNEKFLIYYDGRTQNFFTYELSSGIVRDITSGVKTEWGVNSNLVSRGIPGWTAGDQDVLIYDKTDIWLVDPLGERLAKNLTYEYGVKNNLRFNLMLNKNEDNIIRQNTELYLTAFNLTTYENGFYQVSLGKGTAPKQLFMGKYLFNTPENGQAGFIPLKAKMSDTYVVKRMSANESPNYYATRDFKNFKILSAVYPEKKWNWLSSELHVYDKTNKYRGVLYKPENFDPSKKYPVILYYYQKLSDRVNEYKAPEYSIGFIDIPTFVSRGYLVFCPDIEYRIGFPGESALTCVTVAADYLSTFPYVDKDKFGINGHSFGGFETNYIVTHSDRFKAACSGVGPINMISFYGSIWNGDNRHGFVENGQIGIGKSLWEDKDLYIKNSPIFYADKVCTPLLIFHGNQDEAVPIAQSIEFFNALHRLQKPVWFLQYMNAGHSISKHNDQIDFTVRLQQFFDHYLKGVPAPKWMTMGRPAKLKGIDERLELDAPGITP